MSSELTLLHFHRNLRLHDNAALHIAAGLDRPTVGAFVFPPDCNPRQRVFLRQTLAELRGGLARLDIPLHVFTGDAADALNGLLARYPFAAFVSPLPVRRAADERLPAVYRADEGLPVLSVQPDGLPPDFAAYRTAWLKQARQAGILPPPDAAAWQARQTRLPAECRNVPPLPDAQAIPLAAQGGEAAARRLWAGFLPRLSDYPLHGGFPAKKGVSQLSAHFCFGTLSVREVCHDIRAGRQDGAAWLDGPARRAYCRRTVPFSDGLLELTTKGGRAALHWLQPPKMIRETDGSGGETLIRWQEGRTGVPIIDAAMRALNGGGSLHPALRRLCADFLTGRLNISAAHGEACFAARLTDYEYAVNHHNWQQAGRLNNPFAESLNLDPDGRFIRRHLPELAHLPISALHAPHLAGSDVETNGYPPPCVQV